MPDVTFALVNPADASAQWAMSQYFGELIERFANGFDADSAAAEALEHFAAPRGAFILAELNGEVLGCGAVSYLDEETAEIKRMWIGEKSRGLGLGKRLLARLEEEAAATGRQKVVLDTNGTLTQAINMYRSTGYDEIDRYNDNPYAELWFTKRLRS